MPRSRNITPPSATRTQLPRDVERGAHDRPASPSASPRPSRYPVRLAAWRSRSPHARRTCWWSWGGGREYVVIMLPGTNLLIAERPLGRSASSRMPAALQPSRSWPGQADVPMIRTTARERIRAAVRGDWITDAPGWTYASRRSRPTGRWAAWPCRSRPPCAVRPPAAAAMIWTRRSAPSRWSVQPARCHPRRAPELPTAAAEGKTVRGSRDAAEAAVALPAGVSARERGRTAADR
jgi:hypothetical protein